MTFPPPGELLPHGPEIMLLTRVSADEEERTAAVVEIGPGSPFLVPGKGVPAHVGLEYMAQTCGVFAGLAARRHGEPVRVAYLLGTRRYHASRSWFLPGESLDVAVRLILREDPMAVFDCAISIAGDAVATAQVTVYQPAEPGSAP